MQCIKCGVELKESGVFCPKCLVEMENHPVKPNTPIQLPNRPAPSPVKKKPRRENYTKPEDQIRHLKSQLRWMYLCLIVSLAAFVLTAGMLVQSLRRQQPETNIGQNYGTMDSADATTET